MLDSYRWILFVVYSRAEWHRLAPARLCRYSWVRALMFMRVERPMLPNPIGLI